NLLNGPGSADIRQGNDLVVIREKDRAIGASDQLRYLVLAQVAVEPRLEVEPVSFIDDEGVEGTWRGVDEASRAAEQACDLRATEVPGQALLIHGPRRRISRHVLGQESLAGKACEQVDGHHRLACSWAALDDDHLP